MNKSSQTLSNFIRVKNFIRNLENDPLINKVVFPEIKLNLLETVKMLKLNDYIKVGEEKNCEKMKVSVFMKKKGHQNISLTTNAFTSSMEIALVETGSSVWKTYFNNEKIEVNPADLANFIIQWGKKNNAFINNLKINGIISYAYYDEVIHMNETPKRLKNFYQVESVYNKFKHHGAEHISSIPSDFDFMSLLENENIESQKYSDPLLKNLKYVEENYGTYLVKLIKKFNNVSAFDIKEEIDKLETSCGRGTF